MEPRQQQVHGAMVSGMVGTATTSDQRELRVEVWNLKRNKARIVKLWAGRAVGKRAPTPSYFAEAEDARILAQPLAILLSIAPTPASLLPIHHHRRERLPMPNVYHGHRPFLFVGARTLSPSPTRSRLSFHPV